MKFWEDFFSVNKIIYPIIGSIIFGIIIKLLSVLTNTMLTDKLLIVFMVLGFLIGNYIKLIIINKEDEDNK